MPGHKYVWRFFASRLRHLLTHIQVTRMSRALALRRASRRGLLGVESWLGVYLSGHVAYPSDTRYIMYLPYTQ
ncbi:hypothetical protein FA13DRAFT_1094930 [Coprinellus micaceus]|uniref:Uncharacterized protein n=1 Tax=Coprinellus micaceus TaxID=71717 RepID=A0A4Y7SWB4_COPMI|nr:hypothetical protein FA13DRAFT_1094930 [Coprinellus micaceus]